MKQNITMLLKSQVVTCESFRLMFIPLYGKISFVVGGADLVVQMPDDSLTPTFLPESCRISRLLFHSLIDIKILKRITFFNKITYTY